VSYDAFQGKLDREHGLRAWLRSRPTWVRVVLMWAAVVAVMAVALVSPRPDLAVYPPLRLILGAALLAVVLAFAIRAALRPMHQPAWPRWLVWVVATLAVAVPLLLALLPEPQVAHAASTMDAGAEMAGWPRGCFLYGTMTGVPVVALAWLLDRSIGSGNAIWMGAAAAGLAGNLTLLSHCSISHSVHLLLGHVTVAFAYVVVGAAVGLFRNRLADPSDRS
jgi:hypothetical protein